MSDTIQEVITMTYNLIEGLNEILAGSYLGHDMLVEYAKKIDDEKTQTCFHDLCEVLKTHQTALEMHIRFLHGKPNETLSWRMVMAKYMEKLMLLAVHEDSELIHKAIEAMEMGVTACNRFLTEQEDLPRLTEDLIQQLRNDYSHMDKQLHSLMN